MAAIRATLTSASSEAVASLVSSSSSKTFTRSEVAEHKRSHDCWIIVRGKVYDVTQWLDKHPGGKRILESFAGEDATVAIESFHNNKTLVHGHLARFYIGDVVKEERELSEMDKDFLRLREKLIQKGLFKVKPWYFILSFLHIYALEVMSLAILWKFGTGWVPYFAATLILVTSEIQATWLQHDLGHRSVFYSSFWNNFFHAITIGWSKGSSTEWWNLRHNQHHAKTNVYLKDPEVTAVTFIFGKDIPEELGKKHWGVLPYQHQHKYFFFTLPPFFTIFLFYYESIIHLIMKRKWQDIFWMLAFVLRWQLIFVPLLGGFWPSLKFNLLLRIVESHWFTWTTAINHLSEEIDNERYKDWFTMQVVSTTNTTSNWFADWFLGHMNFQIEHHLFPTMPRHNFKQVQPYVMEFCKKHGIVYKLKPIWTAMTDIVIAMKTAGEIWHDAREGSTLQEE